MNKGLPGEPVELSGATLAPGQRGSQKLHQACRHGSAIQALAHQLGGLQQRWQTRWKGLLTTPQNGSHFRGLIEFVTEWPNAASISPKIWINQMAGFRL